MENMWKQTGKYSSLPKTRVEPDRLQTYVRAYELAAAEARLRGEALTFSEWIRRALDSAAESPS